MYIYIYIYIHNLPPLIINPPQKITLGGNNFFIVNLDGGTITPLIKDDCWFDLPLIINPPNKITLGGTNICYYQFRRRHDCPLHKQRCSVKPPPNTKNWWFCCYP